MKVFVNPHNGHTRKLGRITSFIGAALFGPIYFLAKGHWPAFLIMLVMLTPAFFISWGFAIFLEVVVAFFAYGIIRRHYLSRGFEVQA